MRNFRRFTDLSLQDLPESARLVILAGPNGVGKSSFFDGLMSWYRLKAWGNAHGDAIYNAKVGIEDPTQFYERVSVELHGGERAQSQLQSSSIYLRTAYRHEVDFNSQNLTAPQSPLINTGNSRRAVDVDQAVSENYQRLLWQTFSAVYDEDTPDTATKYDIRERLTGRIRESLQRVLPDLTLTRVGGLGHGQSFEFTKGVSSGFPYVNLSAGEKAVFDLVLDAVVKSEFYDDAIWCIDEPEVHVGTRAQASLLRELFSLVPQNSQLFLASHSLGLMGEAVRMAQENPEEVAFLDFGSRNFDEPVVITPVQPTREFWKRSLEVALDDIAALVAPRRLVLCEGSVGEFDAKCYRKIFAKEFPDVDFVSVGNSHDASTDKIGLTSALQTITSGTEVIRLRDRDLANSEQIFEWQSQGIRTLNRRHIESYLFDASILEQYCDTLGRPEEKAAILEIRKECLRKSTEERGKDSDDIKAASGDMYVQIRKHLSLNGRGTTTQAFALQELAPLISPATKPYIELRKAIFGPSPGVNSDG